MRDERWKHKEKTRKQKNALHRLYYCDSRGKRFSEAFLQRGTPIIRQQEKKRERKPCSAAIKLHTSFSLHSTLSLLTHIHTPLSLALPHIVSPGEGLNEAPRFLLSLFLLRFQFCDALISFSFYCWSRHSCERLQHTGEHAYKHTRRGVNEILQCYLFEIKRDTSSSLVITQMHTDNIRSSIVRGPACIVLVLWRNFANTYT